MHLIRNEKISSYFLGSRHWPSLGYWPRAAGDTALYQGPPRSWCDSSLNNGVRMSESEISQPDSDHDSERSETPVRDEQRSSIILEKRCKMTQAPVKTPDLVTSTEQRRVSATTPPITSTLLPPHQVQIAVPDCGQVLREAFMRPPSPVSDSLIGTHLVSVSGLQARNQLYKDHAQRVRYSVGLPAQSRLAEALPGPAWSGACPGHRPPTISGNPRLTPSSGSSTSTTQAPPWPPGASTSRPPPALGYATHAEGGAARGHCGNTAPPPEEKPRAKKNIRKPETVTRSPWHSFSANIPKNHWVRCVSQTMANVLLQAETHKWPGNLTTDSLLLALGTKTFRAPPPSQFCSEIKLPKTKSHLSAVLWDPAHQMQELATTAIQEKSLILWGTLALPGMHPEYTEAVYISMVQYSLLSLRNYHDLQKDRPREMTAKEADMDREAAATTAIIVDLHPFFNAPRQTFMSLHGGKNVSENVFRDLPFEARYLLSVNWPAAIQAERHRLQQFRR